MIIVCNGLTTWLFYCSSSSSSTTTTTNDTINNSNNNVDLMMYVYSHTTLQNTQYVKNIKQDSIYNKCSIFMH